MYEDHPIFQVPKNPATKIWRYMETWKLKKMIQSASLYCRRTDAFHGDPFEGNIPNRIIEQIEQSWETEVANQPTAELRLLSQALADGSRAVLRGWRRRTAVNCWHMNGEESAAMWSMYTKQGKGVVIQSTVDRLRRALRNANYTAYIGMVEYLDYETADFRHSNQFQLVVRKRASFDFERELRVVVTNDLCAEFSQEGVFVSVDLDSLIASVRLSPASRDEDVAEVQELIGQAKIAAKVEHSCERPLW